MNFGRFGASSQRAGAIGGRDDNFLSFNFVAREFPRGIAEIEVDTLLRQGTHARATRTAFRDSGQKSPASHLRLDRSNSHAAAFAREQHVAITFPPRQRLGDFRDGNYLCRAVPQRSKHCCGRSQNIEHDAGRLGQIALVQGGIFRRREEDFDAFG